jgi:hypothetical protein
MIEQQAKLIAGNLITRQANRIREEIRDGMLFGMPIDNPDAELVAAYYAGMMRESETSKKEFDTLASLIP